MYAVVCAVALLAAALTFFSGFGLGTLLMPAFAFFFPIEVAVAATAVVHLANNLFKAGLVGRHAHWPTVVKFGAPAVVAAFAGAWVLAKLSSSHVLHSYTLGGRTCEITWSGLVIALVIGAFALLELWPRFDKLQFPARLVPVGGAISGFFGGLSGHQGALRTAFLVRLGLCKEAFIATGTIVAVLIDLSRLAVYGVMFFAKDWAVLRERNGVSLVIAAAGAAFVGSFFGAKLMKKVTMQGVRRAVGVMLVLMAVALGAGVV